MKPLPGQIYTTWRVASTWGMSRAEWDRMTAWCMVYFDHPDVRAWLDANCPSAEWQGTLTEYAYTEMMFAPGK